MAEFLGSKTISNQFLGNKVILRTYKGYNLINEYEPLYNPPSDWSDIRTDCPANSISLYAAHTRDFTSYDNLGFTATCTGGYNVFIDGVQYNTTYASGAQCSITWSTSGITTGDDITTPSAMKAHKIWITPATSGNNITVFKCQRVAASGNEQQGLLWAHFNLSNQIALTYLANGSSSYIEPLLTAITAKGNKLSTQSLYYAFRNTALEYAPDFIFASSMSYLLDDAFSNTKLVNIAIKDTAFTELNEVFVNCQDLEKLEFKNVNFSGLTSARTMITNAVNLKDTYIDLSSATGLKKVGLHGDNTHFMGGLKGLRVSSSAPFNHTTAPQINVSYTGLDRAALVQLFNDLPYNVGYTEVGSPTIVDGVLTPTTDVNTYVKADTNLTFNSNSDLEIYCRFKTDAEIPSNNAVVIIGDAVAASKMFCYYYSGWVYFLNLAFDNYTWRVVQPNTWYRAKLTAKNGVWNSYVYDDNENLLGELQSTPTPFGDVTVTIPFGKAPGYENAPVPGGIDLNNTYIKVNGVYWFRGQPAMTKTINVVGCTGTANLTTDDKAIVTDKRWSLTWS